MSLTKLKSELQKHSDRRKAKILQRFFKTGPGEYAEGDIFIGIKVPILRTLAEQYQCLALNETLRLLKSRIHEERLLSLLILILKYRKVDLSEKEKIYKAYLNHSEYINNWDLVDATAKHIIGDFLKDKDRTPLYRLARSDSLWERRIAILSTFHFIENNDFKDTLKIAEILISDPHDLIHKAVGWMLREVGKRDRDSEERFLKKYYTNMPRTMLRYAVEKFPETKRQAYLQGTA
ncbi:MAG: DNA alkylation repair protein [Omnitrophica bacterium GWA2_41_15]|nr:MAG: DNA alkylation repair protein [Omnitrophica bacterium GWA2_41_15]HAZ09559.1 DNA alkylation repair protein [Candidatus Omnitrophota bacterium]